jgi:hypothetical protein
MTKMKKWTEMVTLSSDLHAGAMHHKPLPKLSICEHYHQKAAA